MILTQSMKKFLGSVKEGEQNNSNLRFLFHVIIKDDKQ